MFDVGVATAEVLYQLQGGAPPATSGGVGELGNGNGSLMRILPLVFPA